MKLQHSILQVGDLLIHRVPLSKLLSLCGFSVFLIDDKDSAIKFLEAQPVLDADLAIVDVCSRKDEEVKQAKIITKRIQKISIPIFGVYNSIETNPKAMKDMGITKWIDAFSTPEEVLDQVNSTLFKGARSRRHPRVFPYLPAFFATGEKEVLCRATSLSLGGMFLQTDAILRAGSEVEFKLDIGEGQIVQGNGKVIYVIKKNPMGNILHVSGMGVQFTKLDPQGAKVYASFYKNKIVKVATG